MHSFMCVCGYVSLFSLRITKIRLRSLSLTVTVDCIHQVGKDLTQRLPLSLSRSYFLLMLLLREIYRRDENRETHDAQMHFK